MWMCNLLIATLQLNSKILAVLIYVRFIGFQIQQYVETQDTSVSQWFSTSNLWATDESVTYYVYIII